MLDVLSGLTVRPDKMLENLYRQKDMITTEWLTFQLSDNMGKMKALEKVHMLSEGIRKTGASMKEAVLSDQETGHLFSSEELALLENPERYCGHAVTIVDKVLHRIAEQRKADPVTLSTMLKGA